MCALTKLATVCELSVQEDTHGVYILKAVPTEKRIYSGPFGWFDIL